MPYRRTVSWSCALLIAAAGASQADVISVNNVSEFTGTLPAVIEGDSFEEDEVRYIREVEGFELVDPLSSSDPDGFLGDPIPAGTIVDSYLLFLDPPGRQTVRVSNIVMTFDTRIVGVFGGVGTLNDTDFLGRPGQSYGDWSGLAGLEGGEGVFLFDSFYSLGIEQLSASSPGDYVRIVTLARPSDVVPEPASMTLLGGGLALAVLARRFRRN